MKTYSEVKMISVDGIHPYFNNPRNNDNTVDKLVGHLQRVGFNVPMVIDKENIIVKGHARFYAAKRLGFKEVPCIITDATEEKNKADRIYDNSIQDLSEWDKTILNLEIKSIDDIVNEAADSNGSENEIHVSVFESKQEVDKFIDERIKADHKMKMFICPECGAEHEIKPEDIDGLR